MTDLIVTADNAKHKHFADNPTVPTEAEAELRRLEGLFGEQAPRLSAEQFAESLQSATPITQSLFRQFYAEKGSWGKFLKRYHIPHRHYQVEAYLPSVFDRLYINKSEERRILYQEPGGDLEKQEATAFVGAPKFSFLMRHPWVGACQILAATRLTMGTYYHYRRFDKSLKPMQLSAEATLEALASAREHMVNETVPQLFRVTAFRGCCLQTLYQRIYRHVNPEVWEQMLRPAVPSLITQTLQSATNQSELVEKLGHRGPQEMELAEPRWAEKQTDLITQYRPGSFDSKALDEVTTLRKSIIERFASSWDKQLVETHFMLYDYYYACRERVHDQWIRELTHMRNLLLRLDADAKLNGLIWYASLDEIFSLYPKLDLDELSRRRDTYNNYLKIALPTELKGESWSSLVGNTLQPQAASTYPVRRLVGGRAEGNAGTVEDLKQGKQVAILVVKSLDPGFVVYYDRIQGIITEAGGLLSHGTILARELGIPAVCLSQATNLIASDTHVTIDASEEQIEISN